MGRPKKDNMVESGYWNGFVNGVPGDDSFHDVINLFDSMESLDGDDSVDTEDWEAQFQSLGPIPSEILQGFDHVSQSNVGNDMQGFWPNNFILSGGTSELKQLPDVVEVSSDSSHAKKSSLYHTPSPISVLESSGSYSAEKSMSTSPELLIPVRTRSKRQRRSTFCKWHLISPITPSEKTLNKKGKEKKRKKPSQVPEDSKVKENHQHMHSKRCTHCQVTKTPQWREGPMGPRTLCNACGVRYRSGRLLPEYRPLASPTFVPSLHSNSHRKVIQMRNKFIKESSMRKMNPAMLPPPEIFPMKVMQMRNKGIQESSMPEMNPAMLPPPEIFPMKVMQQMRNEVVQESLVPEMDPEMSPPPEFVPMSSYLFDRI